MSTSSRNSNPDEKVTIGYISSAHGIKGEVRIVPLTDYTERFQGMTSLNLCADGLPVRTLRVRRIRKHEGKGELIVESDLKSRDEADRLVGMSVTVSPEERFPLPEGHFWVDDLIGLRVEDREGNVLGKVSDFISFAGSETYEVKDENGGMHYIPAVEKFIGEIDLSSGKIVVDLIEGLW